ncbi:MAG: hypothetical protein AAF391_00725 [Bacteroidota bacterium]
MHIVLFLTLLSCTGQELPDIDFQIRTALLAAPEHQREAATVMGYASASELTVIKEGRNDFICIADNPSKEGFSVAAYHKRLEPFMSRGRELKKQGMNPKEVFDAREEEVKAGTLDMPDRATLYVTTGTLNEETNELEDLYTRFVVYIPYATEESTGLPLSPGTPGAPWIMDPGTHRAHIMINPPKN